MPPPPPQNPTPPPLSTAITSLVDPPLLGLHYVNNGLLRVGNELETSIIPSVREIGGGTRGVDEDGNVRVGGDAVVRREIIGAGVVDAAREGSRLRRMDAAAAVALAQLRAM